MTKTLVQEVTIDQCPSCNGTWFDRRELGKVAQERAIERRAHARAHGDGAPTIRCPRCSATCHEAWVGDVEIDVCGDCGGVWLDAFEVESVRRAFAEERIRRHANSGFLDLLAKI
jgi:Zn-finger nucleic acid-binding protein